MDFRFALKLLPFLLALSCAQVGQISGGEEDLVAPEPVKTVPENKTLFFKEQSIKLVFDEFVELNNPQQNIIIVPNDAKLKASLHKKELVLSWEESLKSNTTYVIYFNGAVKDVTEKNQSLFSYVFSTGAQIDTLQQEIMLRDALNGQAISDATVGFYAHKDSLKPIYFSSSDGSGKASMNYMKQGEYYVKAFKDDNKNLIADKNELVGFLTDLVKIQTDNTDTLMIQMFQPEIEQSITTVELQSPGSFLVSTSNAAFNPLFDINDKALDSIRVRKIDDKLFKLFPVQLGAGDYKILFYEKENQDSSTVRTSEKDWSMPLKITSASKDEIIVPGETISLSVNAFLKTIDTSKISIYDEKDTVNPIKYTIQFAQDMLQLLPSEELNGTFVVTLLPGALTTEGGEFSEAFSKSYRFKSMEELGIIHVSTSGFIGGLILELMKDKGVVDEKHLLAGNKATFENLVPGEYQLRVIEDENRNGKWDSGNEVLGIQPEKVFLFTKPTKVRPNWEYNLKINPSGNYE